MTKRLLTLLQNYPDYSVTGSTETNNWNNWGKLHDIRVLHDIQTIKLIFKH